ncbi:MAG TPA: hypothetical protein VGT40_22440 [Methylomirabilota bacterium]|jgi:hypothetical protein|nr:hypothetical protein [Methylomirabilota bacterium]
MPGKKSKGNAAAYARLGDFIFDENPYSDEVKYPANLKKAKGVQRFGPGAKRGADKPFTIRDVRKVKGLGHIFKKGLFWKVGSRTLRMSKAVRIPYTYVFKKHGQKGEVVKEVVNGYLVVGYEGAGGGM